MMVVTRVLRSSTTSISQSIYLLQPNVSLSEVNKPPRADHRRKQTKKTRTASSSLICPDRLTSYAHSDRPATAPGMDEAPPFFSRVMENKRSRILRSRRRTYLLDHATSKGEGEGQTEPPSPPDAAICTGVEYSRI